MESRYDCVDLSDIPERNFTTLDIVNKITPKRSEAIRDVLQAVEEDDWKENSDDIATTVIETMSR